MEDEIKQLKEEVRVIKSLLLSLAFAIEEGTITGVVESVQDRFSNLIELK